MQATDHGPTCGDGVDQLNRTGSPDISEQTSKAYMHREQTVQGTDTRGMIDSDGLMFDMSLGLDEIKWAECKIENPMLNLSMNRELNKPSTGSGTRWACGNELRLGDVAEAVDH